MRVDFLSPKTLRFVPTMKYFLTPLILALFLFSSSCADDSKQSPSKAKLIISGKGNFGKVVMYKMEDGSVWGSANWGKSRFRYEVGDSATATVIRGNTSLGKAVYLYEGDRIHGTAPHGKLDLNLSESKWTGGLAWGNFAFSLDNENVIRGTLPFGKIALRLEDDYDSLADKDVVLALLILLSTSNRID